jgi:hypothetical protein
MMLLITLLALATPTDGKIMHSDDWNPAVIVAVGSASPTSSATYIEIQAGDLDADGLPDDAYLKLACSDGRVAQSWYQIKGPRDAASGQATGKRMHKPVTFVKEWGPSSPQLREMHPTYDVKTLKGARTAAGGDEWSPISLANTDGLCEEAGAAALKGATKTRSNIQNN